MKKWKLAIRGLTSAGLGAVTVAIVLLEGSPPSHAEPSRVPEDGIERDAAGPDEAGALNLRMYELERKRNYVDAIPVAQRYAELIRAREGAGKPTYIATLNHLAVLYRLTHREADAVAAHREALAAVAELAAAEPDNPQWRRDLAKCHISLAKAGADPEGHFGEAQAILKRLESEGRFDRWDARWLAIVESNRRRLAISRLFEAGAFQQALELAEQEAQAREREQAAGQQGALRAAAEALDAVARHALFARQPEKALAASERALALAPNLPWLGANRAHALLFLGRSDDALAAYREHEGEILNAKGGWGALIARDFRDFRARGIDHPLMSDVERALHLGPQRVAKATLARSLPCGVAGLADAVALARCDADNTKTDYGETSPEYARALTRLAALLNERSQFAEASGLYRRSIGILAQILPPDHPQVGQLLLKAPDKEAKARGLQILDKALTAETLAKRIDPDDAPTAAALLELAEARAREGRTTEAERARRILAQADKPPLPGPAAGPEDLKDARSRVEATYAQALGEDPFGELAGTSDESLDRSREAFYNAILSSAGSGGGDASFSPYREQYLALSERLLLEVEPNKRAQSDILVGLADLYAAAGRFAEAERALRRAVALRESLQGPGHPDVTRMRERLTTFDRGRGR